LQDHSKDVDEQEFQKWMAQLKKLYQPASLAIESGKQLDAAKATAKAAAAEEAEATAWFRGTEAKAKATVKAAAADEAKAAQWFRGTEAKAKAAAEAESKAAAWFRGIEAKEAKDKTAGKVEQQPDKLKKQLADAEEEWKNKTAEQTKIIQDQSKQLEDYKKQMNKLLKTQKRDSNQLITSILKDVKTDLSKNSETTSTEVLDKVEDMKTAWTGGVSCFVCATVCWFVDTSVFV
jgi:small-conductance mechanosensitive channel